MPNYAFRCPKCEKLEDHMLSYDKSIEEGIVVCPDCGIAMIKFFGKKAPMMVVPIGTTGNSDNGYTSVSNVQKDRNGI